MRRYTAFVLVFLSTMCEVAHGAGEQADRSICDIGSRRELFVDTFLIDRLKDAHLPGTTRMRERFRCASRRADRSW